MRTLAGMSIRFSIITDETGIILRCNGVDAPDLGFGIIGLIILCFHHNIAFHDRPEAATARTYLPPEAGCCWPIRLLTTIRRGSEIKCVTIRHDARYRAIYTDPLFFVEGFLC